MVHDSAGFFDGAIISRFDSLAAGDATNRCCLQADDQFSAGRTLRAHKPDSTLRCFNSEQHSGGSRAGKSGEFRQFLSIARGSNCEVQTQLEIARELNYGKPHLIQEAEALSDEVRRMLFGLLDSLKEA